MGRNHLQAGVSARLGEMYSFSFASRKGEEKSFLGAEVYF